MKFVFCALYSSDNHQILESSCCSQLPTDLCSTRPGPIAQAQKPFSFSVPLETAPATAEEIFPHPHFIWLQGGVPSQNASPSKEWARDQGLVNPGPFLGLWMLPRIIKMGAQRCKWLYALLFEGTKANESNTETEHKIRIGDIEEAIAFLLMRNQNS